MEIKMSRFGSSLCTRSSGKAAYSFLSQLLSASVEPLVFDFSEVGTITNSFADETFGRLASDVGMDELKRKTTFKNIDRSSAIQIRMAMERRVRFDRAGVSA